MRGELSRLRGVEEEAKNKTNQVSSLLEELERLKKELSTTQQEKKTIEDWAQTYRDEMEKVRRISRSRPGPPTPCLQYVYHSVICPCPRYLTVCALRPCLVQNLNKQ